MKIRMDFVTNSSSSSFILGVKGDLSREEILRLLKVPEDSVLRGMAEKFASIIYSGARKFDLDKKLKDYDCDDISELPTIYNVINKKSSFTFYEGTIWDDTDYTSAALCNMDFEYEDENFIFYKD